MKKLNDSQGETLVEVLASILIGALSVTLLFTAVMASVNMDRTSKEVDGEFQSSLQAAEKQVTGITDPAIVPTDAKVTVKNTSGGTAAEPSVTFYGGKGAISYSLNPPPASPP